MENRNLFRRATPGLLVLLAASTGNWCAAAEPQSPVGVSPADNTADVCPDTPLRLTFDAPPTPAGKLEIREGETLIDSIDLAAPTVTRTLGTIANFNTHPAIVDDKTLIITPSKPLAYGHTYSITLTAPAGLRGPASWRFTTKKAPPAAGSTKLTVAADNSGDFATIQGALDFIPEANATATTVTIKKGTYHEIIAFTNKHNLTLVGEDRKGTILVETNNAKVNPQGSPYHRGLFIANRCNDLVIANMTFRNTTPSGGSQAESVILDRVQRAIITDVDLYSLQDTLQINGQAYIQNSYIEGDVDFIWGTGPCFFQDVTSKSMRSRAYYTQIRNTNANHGYIFNKCTFIGADNAVGGAVVDNVLSRIDPNRFPASEVVLIDCTMSDAVSPAAWRLDMLAPPGDQNAVKPETYPNIHFWEFNSRTPDGKPVDTSKRHPICRQLKEPADTETINNYRNPTWVLGGSWTPKVPSLNRAALPPSQNAAANNAAEAALDKKLPVDRISGNDMPLDAVFGLLRMQPDLRLQVDWAALEQVGITRQTKITLDERDITIRQYLRAVVGKLKPSRGTIERAVEEGVVKIRPKAPETAPAK